MNRSLTLCISFSFAVALLFVGILKRERPAVRSSQDVAVAPPVHLTAEQLIDFATDGYLRLRPDVPSSVHRKIVEKARGQRKMGNNIFPQVRELEDIIESPIVRGALEDLLGESYVLHRHRHLHFSNSLGQDWHKDSYFGTRRMRSHAPRFLMLMYYPQKTRTTMGPTAVVPGSQYYTFDHETGDTRKFKIGEDRNMTVFEYLRSSRYTDVNSSWMDRFGSLNQPPFSSSERRLTCDAGEVVIIHYDLFHRSTRKAFASPKRLMFKLQFYRISVPQFVPHPSLHPMNSAMRLLSDPVADYVLRWTRGGNRSVSASSLAFDLSPIEVGLAIRGARERQRIRAAYTAGHVARAAEAPQADAMVEVLASALCEEREAVRRAATFGLIASGNVAVAALVRAFDGCATPARKYALFALGEVGEPNSASMRVLCEAAAVAPGESYEAMLEKATALFALGLVGQRAFLLGRRRAALQVFDALLEAATVSDGSEGFGNSDFWHASGS